MEVDAVTEYFDLLAALEFARTVARRAGEVLRDAYYQPREIDFKGAVNLVTQADYAAEKLIVDALQEAYPGFAFLAEEGGEIAGDNGFRWLIDPLDGTNNFAHGYPVFAVSIALYEGTDPLLGVIYDPLRDECFSAAKGHGAALNGQPMHVSQIPDLRRALVATGFPYDRQTHTDNNVRAVDAFLRRAQGLRRAGAAALDLAYVAAGRLDAYWEKALGAWDLAAGILLVREAGGSVTPYSADAPVESLLRGESIVATNGLIHREMLDVLASVYDYTADGGFHLRPLPPTE